MVTTNKQNIFGIYTQHQAVYCVARYILSRCVVPVLYISWRNCTINGMFVQRFVEYHKMHSFMFLFGVCFQ